MESEKGKDQTRRQQGQAQEFVNWTLGFLDSLDFSDSLEAKFLFPFFESNQDWDLASGLSMAG